MKTKEIKQWMDDPSLMDRESMLQLKAVLEEYPCFTIARMLYLKSLLNLNDLHFSATLIKTAISTPDRRRLYYFIEGKRLPERLEKPQVPLESGGFSLIDRFLQGSTPSDAPRATPMEDEAETFSVEIPKESPAKDDEGFVLNYAEFLTMQPEGGLTEPVEPMNGQDLIDQFLEKSANNDPKIRIRPAGDKALNGESVEDIVALEQMVSSFNLPEDSFTETLARIYLKQKRYDRALEIFKSLSLKYPEKNVYFADQIRFLEKLIIHIKK